MKNHRIFFPLAWIPAFDMLQTLNLFEFCENNDIEIIWSTDAYSEIKSSVVSPNGATDSKTTIQIFYGAVDSVEQFERIFKFEYCKTALHKIQEIVLNEIGPK